MKFKRFKKMPYLLLFLAVLTFGFSWWHHPANAKDLVIQTGPVSTAQGAIHTPIDFRTAFANVAKEAIPAVVHVEVTESQEVSNPLMPFENDPFFHYFFNMPQQNMPRKFKREMRGLGTGMIMDSKGYILTNNHVVAGANDIEVQLADGARYKASLVGADPKTDLAVIRIKADKPLPHLVFGDSDKMEVGDCVVAIGEPRGLYQTVTHGIISAKHRRGIMNPDSYQDYLQTDAAINPGNSGGPLLNLDGQVIGINSAIVSDSGGFEGIGFAIPSNMAVHIAKELIAHGKVARGWLGVSIQAVTPQVAKDKHLSVDHGALIMSVVKNSPAGEAGLETGDVIIAYKGESIGDAADLQNDVADTTIGETVAMTVRRDGKDLQVKVKIGDLANAILRMAESLKDRLGVVVRPVTKAEAEKYGMDKPKGVAIKSLVPGGVLDREGFEKGYIILMIDGQSFEGVQDFVDMVQSLKPNQRIQLMALDHRTGQTGYLWVQVR